MPRIRKGVIARSAIEIFWRIGLYIRLSREDENENESESVINQEKILRDFDYRRLKSKVTEQIRQLEANISYLKEEISAIENGIGTDDPYLMSFLKYRNIQSLNRGILVELVKAVWVHKNGEITVDFNFADEFQRILDYIECEHSALTPMEQKAAM